MSIVRNQGDAIDYEIPITGNLKDPKFRMWKVVEGILTNIFVKPPSTPYLVHTLNLEKEVEKFLTVKWDMRQTQLKPAQLKFLENVSAFLARTPDALITVHPIQYTNKEKECIMFFLAKKLYFENKDGKTANQLTTADSIQIDKMSAKDSGFVRFLDKQIGDTMLFTIQEKCLRVTGQKAIDNNFYKLMALRDSAFSAAFKSSKVIGKVKMFKDEDAIPFDGFSYYKIEYKGEWPQSLLKDYYEMNEINETPPRGNYEKDRRKNGGVLVEETQVK